MLCTSRSNVWLTHSGYGHVILRLLDHSEYDKHVDCCGRQTFCIYESLSASGSFKAVIMSKFLSSTLFRAPRGFLGMIWLLQDRAYPLNTSPSSSRFLLWIQSSQSKDGGDGSRLDEQVNKATKAMIILTMIIVTCSLGTLLRCHGFLLTAPWGGLKWWGEREKNRYVAELRCCILEGASLAKVNSMINDKFRHGF